MTNKESYNLCTHSTRVAELSLVLAKYMGFESDLCYKIYNAAEYHDLGKRFIPEEILNAPRQLTKKEFDLVKTHSAIGANTMKALNFDDEITTIVLQHHEKFDGSGYPQGLKGNEIHIGAQIIEICDIYDALTNDRPYKKTYTKEEALTILYNEKNKFNPTVFSSFIRAIMSDEPEIHQKFKNKVVLVNEEFLLQFAL